MPRASGGNPGSSGPLEVETDPGRHVARKSAPPPPQPACAPFSPPLPLLARERPRPARMIGSRPSGRPRHEPLPKKPSPAIARRCEHDEMASDVPRPSPRKCTAGRLSRGRTELEDWKARDAYRRWLANDTRRRPGWGARRADFSALRAGPQFLEERTRRPSCWQSAASDAWAEEREGGGRAHRERHRQAWANELRCYGGIITPDRERIRKDQTPPGGGTEGATPPALCRVICNQGVTP